MSRLYIHNPQKEKLPDGTSISFHTVGCLLQREVVRRGSRFGCPGKRVTVYMRLSCHPSVICLFVMLVYISDRLTSLYEFLDLFLLENMNLTLQKLLYLRHL